MTGTIFWCPPSGRDLEHKADIAEEIARFYGYNKIPATSLSAAVRRRPLYPHVRSLSSWPISDTMLALGL